MTITTNEVTRLATTQEKVTTALIVVGVTLVIMPLAVYWQLLNERNRMKSALGLVSVKLL